MVVIENGKSSSENLKKISWVDEQTEEALNKLGVDTEKKFYEEDSEKKVVTYKMEVVKQYLASLYEKVKDITNTREAWNKLVEEGNTSAWIMAVQIALESLGNSTYDVGKIDGILGKETKNAVKNFQKDNGLTPDGAPGRDTIKVLLEKMGGAVEYQEDPFKDVKVKEEVDVPEEREVEAGDLVEGLPEGATVEFEEGSSVDKTKDGEEQEVTVIVKKGENTKKITIIVKVDVENKKITAKEKAEEEDPFKDVKVKEEVDVPEEREVEAGDLVEGLPEGATVEFEEGSSVDKTKDGEEQEVTVVVKKGENTKKITIIVKVDVENKKITAKEKAEEEDPFKDVKVKEEVDVPEEREVEAGDLVEGLPEGATVEFEEGSSVDKTKDGEEQEVTVIVKKGENTKKITIIVKVDVENKKITAKEKAEEEDPFKDVKVKEEVDVPEEREVEAGDLVEGLPEGATVEFEEGSSVDKTKDGEEQEVTVIVKKGENTKKITIIVKVDVENKKITAKEKAEEEDPFKDVKVKEEVDVPEEREVEAGDLVEGLPEGATVEFEEGSSVDKTKDGEEQEVTVIVKKGENTKKITIIVKVDVENKKVTAKEKKEDREDEEIPEKSRLDALTIDDLGVWELNGNGNFEFHSGVINEETKELTVKDKTIPMIENGGEGFGYIVKDGLVRIGNIKNGVLDGYGVEFYPYGDEFQEEGNYNAYGIKLQGEWKEGELKDGLEIVRENGLIIDIEIKEGKPTKAYSEDESISVDFENREDGLYLKNKNSTLKLKNKYSSVAIIKILNDYKDKEGSFSTDLSEGYKSKKIIWTPADGDEKEVKEVYRYADNLISDEMFESEGLRLSGWLNEYRETHREFKLEEYGEFDEEGKFTFKEGVEQTDENGKKYIEYNKEKYYEYENGLNGLGYNIGMNDNNIGRVYLGNYVDGKREGKGTEIWADGDRYEGEWKDGKKEGKGTYIFASGDKYEGEWKGNISEGKGRTTWANGNKFEGEYKNDEMEKGKFTIVTPEEIAGEYEVERDEKGLRIVSGEHEGKYIKDEEWKIEERVESSEDEAKFKLEEYGEFDSEGKFAFKEGVEKTDEDGKKYIEYNNEKYYEYEDGINGQGYKVGGDYFYIGDFKDGKIEGQGTMIWADGDKVEGEWKNNQMEGEGTTIWANGNKFVGERKENKIEKGKFTIVTPEEIVGEYEVERDDKGLRIVSEGENNGKYLDAVNWKIEEKTDSDEESDENSGENSDEGDEEVKDLTEEEYTVLCQKTELTYDEVKQLVKFVNDKERGFIYLDWLRSIDKEIATELSNVKGKLAFLGLTSIDKEIATELSKHQGELWLRLTSIDKEIATELSKHQGELVLTGLTSISDDVAAELAKVEHLTIEKDILTEEQKKILHIG